MVRTRWRPVASLLTAPFVTAQKGHISAVKFPLAANGASAVKATIDSAILPHQPKFRSTLFDFFFHFKRAIDLPHLLQTSLPRRSHFASRRRLCGAVAWSKLRNV